MEMAAPPDDWSGPVDGVVADEWSGDATPEDEPSSDFLRKMGSD
jgi:hypothetical protein